MIRDNEKSNEKTNDEFDEFINNNRELVSNTINASVTLGFEIFKFWVRPWLKQALKDYYKNYDRT